LTAIFVLETLFVDEVLTTLGSISSNNVVANIDWTLPMSVGVTFQFPIGEYNMSEVLKVDFGEFWVLLSITSKTSLNIYIGR